MRKLINFSLMATLLISLSGCVVSHTERVSESSKKTTQVSRHYHNDWEQEIGYAQLVRVGNTLHVSGITGRGETMEQQIVSVYDRIRDVLATYGATPDHIVKEILFTTDIEAVKAHIPLRKSYFSKDNYPAATWVQIERLFLPEIQLEVDVTVQIPE